MIKKILNNKLFKDSFVYVFADVINKAIPFLLLPVLTYYLTPADYGIIAVFNSFMNFIALFIGFSLVGTISVNYYKFERKQLAKYIGNVIAIVLITFFFVLLLSSSLSNIIYAKIGLSYKYIIIAILVSVFSSITTINLTLWVLEQKPKYYGELQISETIIKLGLSLYFIVILSMNWEGRILGIFIGSLISCLISLVLLYKRGYLKLNLDRFYIKDILNFSLPLIFHRLSFWFKNGAIIFLLAYLVGKKETGLYNVGAQFVLPIAVLTAAFNKAWAPYLYRTLSNNPTEQNKRKIVKFTYLYMVGIVFVAILLSLIAPLIIKLLLEKSFIKASVYVFYLSLAAAFQGMYFMVVNYIFYTKKTKYLAYITFGSSLVNVALAYLLISKYGAIGAAQALLVANILSFILVWYYSNKVYAMPWKIKK